MSRSRRTRPVAPATWSGRGLRCRDASSTAARLESRPAAGTGPRPGCGQPLATQPGCGRLAGQRHRLRRVRQSTAFRAERDRQLAPMGPPDGGVTSWAPGESRQRPEGMRVPATAATTRLATVRRGRGPVQVVLVGGAGRRGRLRHRSARRSRPGAVLDAQDLRALTMGLGGGHRPATDRPLPGRRPAGTPAHRRRTATPSRTGPACAATTAPTSEQ